MTPATRDCHSPLCESPVARTTLTRVQLQDRGKELATAHNTIADLHAQVDAATARAAAAEKAAAEARAQAREAAARAESSAAAAAAASAAPPPPAPSAEADRLRKEVSTLTARVVQADEKVGELQVRRWHVGTLWLQGVVVVVCCGGNCGGNWVWHLASTLLLVHTPWCLPPWLRWMDVDRTWWRC